MRTGSFPTLDERSRVIRHRAGDFTQHLIKTFLQTTYYSAEHPLARTSIEEVYQKFTVLMQDAYEISYVLQSLTDERGVLIENLLPEPIEVAQTLKNILGDYFIAKLHEYFVRNQIASFTIKRGIDRQEFETFLSIWVAGATKGPDKNLVRNLTDELNRQGVFRVTVVGMEELVGMERHLSWPVRSALSRLRKDLLRIPVIRSVRNESSETLRSMIISDIMRPITKADVARDVLLNLDLAVGDIAGINEESIAELLIFALAQNLVLPVAQSLLDLLEKQEKRDYISSAEAHILMRLEREDVRRMIGKLLSKLGTQNIFEVRVLLETAFKRGLITRDALPLEIQRHIKADELTRSFLSASDDYLKEFEMCGNPKTYLKYLNVMAYIVPVLIEREASELVGRIFTIFHKHLSEKVPPFVGRSRFIQDTFKTMEKDGVLDGLLRLITVTPKEKREGIEIGISLFGASAVPGLVAMLASTDDISSRKVITRVLAQLGEDAVPLLIDELKAHRHPPAVARCLIETLGEMRARKALDIIMVYGKHPNEKVREGCVNAIANIEEERSQHLLLTFLKDKDEMVVRRAVQHLGALHCMLPEFIAWVADTIRLRTHGEEEPSEMLQITCLKALLQYEDMKLDDYLEDCLIELIDPPKFKRLLPGRYGIRMKSRDIVILGIRVLGAIGSGKALNTLSNLLDTKDEQLKEVVTEATEQIRHRQTSSLTRRPSPF